MARIHAGEHGAERPVPPVVASFRVRPEAAAALNAFANSPENVQLLARGKANEVAAGLKQPPEKLWLKYEKESASWPEHLRISRSLFLTFFNQSCFQLLKAKSCLCGPCHEHGTLNFEALNELLSVLETLVGAKVAKSCKVRAERLHGYLAHEFRGRCSLSSTVETQCITHALCGSLEWGCECNHGNHVMSCAEDNERFKLVDDIRLLIAAQRGCCPADDDLEEWEARLDIMEEDLARFEHSLELYVQHLMRKALSSQVTPRALQALHDRLSCVHIIVDYKQKWLPVKHNETQSDSFGKRGKSIWGACVFRWAPSTSDYEVMNIRIACDDSKQNWWVFPVPAPCTRQWILVLSCQLYLCF